jgi:hypothetical protein
MSSDPSHEKKEQDSFADAGRKAGRTSFLGEFVGFLRENRKWWLGPIILLLLLFGLLTILAATGAAPWVYTLF